MSTAGATFRRPPSPFTRWFRAVGWRHLVGLLALVFALFPVIWAFSASINPTGALQSQKLIPKDPSFKNYGWLFSHPNQPYPKWLRNSVLIGLGTAVGTVAIASLAAFSFSRLRFKGRRVGLMTLLLGSLAQATAVVGFVFTQDEAGLFAVAAAFGLGFSGLIPAYILTARQMFPAHEASWRMPALLLTGMSGMAMTSANVSSNSRRFGRRVSSS